MQTWYRPEIKCQCDKCYQVGEMIKENNITIFCGVKDNIKIQNN
jgi:hypothetical protein